MMLKYHAFTTKLPRTSVKFAPAPPGKKPVSRINGKQDVATYPCLIDSGMRGASGHRYWSAFNELLCDNLTSLPAEIAHVHDAAPLIKPLEFQRLSSQVTCSVSEVRCNNSDYGDENWFDFVYTNDFKGAY